VWPKEINVGSARTPKMVKVIAWGAKFLPLTSEQTALLGGLNVPAAPKKAAPAPRCRVCGGKVDYLRCAAALDLDPQDLVRMALERWIDEQTAKQQATKEQAGAATE